MLSTHTIQSTKRWLPLLLLLMVLAQLVTNAHEHRDEHSVTDCTLCLHHSNLNALHGSHVLPGLPVLVAIAPTSPLNTLDTPDFFRFSAIRAPPVISPSSLTA